MAALSAAHRDALATIVGTLSAATAPWWIIAGTAVALQAQGRVKADDIDVLIGMDDVPLIRALPGIRIRAGDDHSLFRSRFYAASEVGGIEVEYMAGFELCHAGRWEPVWPRSRVLLDLGDGLSVPVPDRDELAGMLARFGREKDIARIALLNG